jgi:hypothetical protein
MVAGLRMARVVLEWEGVDMSNGWDGDSSLFVAGRWSSMKERSRGKGRTT